MLVSHNNDLDTHAIIGGKDIEAFGIAETPEFFTVLSDTLYGNKPVAVIREIVCNGWDAHIASGRTDTPLVITTTEDQLVIRDSGLGIPHHLVHGVYCVYGNSTKKNDGKQTGGFGLGSKAPFAYSEHFTVDNRHDGKRVVHAISRGSALTKGKPDRRVMVEVPTEESGITVSIPLKNPNDAKLFNEIITDICYFGDIRATLNGKELDRIGLSDAENNLFLTDITTIPNCDTSIVLRYGNVLYPVRLHEEIQTLFEQVINALDNLPKPRRFRHYYGSVNSPWKLILQAPANSIGVQPSREGLSMSETTVNTLNQLFKEILPVLNMRSPEMLEKMEKYRNWGFDRIFNQGRPFHAFTTPNLLENLEKVKMVNQRGDTFQIIRSLDDLAKLSVEREITFRENPETHLEQYERAGKLLIYGWKHRQDLIWFQRTYEKSHGRSWNISMEFKKRTIRRLVRGLAANPILKPKYFQIRYSGQASVNEFRSGYVEAIKGLPQPYQVFPLMQRMMVVTYSKTALETDWIEFVKGNRFLKKDLPLFVYACPRSVKHKEEAIRFFERMGYVVFDHASYLEREAARQLEEYKRREALYGKSPQTLPILAKPKPVGLPMLSSNILGKESFDKRGHLQDNLLVNTRYNRNTVFEAIIQPKSLSGRDFQHKFFPWGDNAARHIADLLGDKIAVAQNCKQLDKWIAEGKIRGEEYILDKLSENILNNPRILEHFANKAINVDGEISLKRNRLYRIAENSPLIKARLPVRPTLTLEDIRWTEIYNEIEQHVQNRYFHPTTDWERKAKALVDKVKEIPASATMRGFIFRLHSSPLLNFLDLVAMGQELEQMQRHKSLYDTKRQIFIEIAVLNALK